MSGRGVFSRSGRSASPRRRPWSPGSRCSRRPCATGTTSALTQIGVMLGIAGLGATLTLLPWGLAADRVGERTTGSRRARRRRRVRSRSRRTHRRSRRSCCCSRSPAPSASSSNTATGRAVTSWFPRAERGFALGIRQTSVPIGGFAAALGIPVIVDRVELEALRIARARRVQPARCRRSPSPGCAKGRCRATCEDEADVLRHPVRDRRIWRLSFGSSALIFTQVAITGFVVLYLESHRDFSAVEAGLVLAAINVVGAAGRLLAGRCSDRRGGGRVVLIRWIAVATTVALAATVALAGLSSWLLLPALVFGGGLAMSWNGLSVAATVEAAGRGQARRGARLPADLPRRAGGGRRRSCSRLSSTRPRGGSGSPSPRLRAARRGARAPSAARLSSATWQSAC